MKGFIGSAAGIAAASSGFRRFLARGDRTVGIRRGLTDIYATWPSAIR